MSKEFSYSCMFWHLSYTINLRLLGVRSGLCQIVEFKKNISCLTRVIENDLNSQEFKRKNGQNWNYIAVNGI